MNSKQPFANAVGIEGEKIVAIGNQEELKIQMGNRYSRTYFLIIYCDFNYS
ncbi:MAG: hypothetical protein ACFFA0_13670 [Promethearchaeota archaeon]